MPSKNDIIEMLMGEMTKTKTKKLTKTKRKPSKYNLFIKKKLKSRSFHPDEDHKTRFSLAVEEWNNKN